MPELGKYAVTVLSAYGATLGLLIGIVVLSLWQSARAKARLDRAEERGAAGE